MSRSSSRSLFGVPGSRGARASVSSLEGLRKVLRNEQDREIIPQARASLQRADVPDSSAPPAADDAENKQTLRGLNDRLVGYLERVKRLREENQDLQNQIDEIEAKRKDPRGRDWKQTLDFLEELNKKVGCIILKHLLFEMVSNLMFWSSDQRDHPGERKDPAADQQLCAGQ